MENFETEIKGETYKVTMWSTNPLTFRILHHTGATQIGRRDDGVYVELLRIDFAKNIPIELIGEEINMRL